MQSTAASGPPAAQSLSLPPPGPLVSHSGFRDTSAHSASMFVGNMLMSSAWKFWKQVPILECGGISYFLKIVSNSSREEYIHVSQISL